MDAVDDGPHLVTLASLHLEEEDAELVTRLARRFAPLESKYLVIQRGLSTAIKIALKPARLFPFLVKIDVRDEVLAEAKGDRLLRLRVPPLSMPPFVAVEEGPHRAAIMYRYVTGGRVKEVVDRLDVYLSRVGVSAGQAALVDILDVILKKCHWLDGDSKVRSIELPDIVPPADAISKQLQDSVSRYRRLRVRLRDVRGPHAVIHGDLHPKNILLTRHCGPVLIDFRRAQEEACVYWDYARLETYIQWQVAESLSATFGRVSDRVYSGESLILPRSREPLASYIHTVRTVLWRNCLSRTVGLSQDEIDLGHRGHLVRQLLGYAMNVHHSDENRLRAHQQAQGLLQNVV